jgi:uncharacterized membrane protein YbhN (UPF0104 family)
LQNLIRRGIGTVRDLLWRIGWGRLGIALSLTVFAAALTSLIHTLRDVDFTLVIAAIRATTLHRIILAAIFVACGYLTLTFYDLFALRTIGRTDVPYRVAALGSFTSYAIGHNIGLTVLSGGAVRFRIYSAWGLTLADIAKIAFVTGLTFWLGNAFTLGIGLAFDPLAAAAIDHLSASVNRAIGILAIIAIVSYLIWLSSGPRSIGRANLRIILPGARLTCLQIGIGVLDLAITALAMYMLMPVDPAIDFIRLLVIFILATLLGFASHAPGGLGVFDASMLFALAHFEKESLLASLVLFRLLYYVTPFCLALTILASREFWMIVQSRATRVRIEDQADKRETGGS